MIKADVYPPVVPEEIQDTVAWIPRCNLPKLTDKIEKLNRKADKLGLNKITFNVIIETLYTTGIRLSAHDSRKDTMMFVLVEVEGETIKLPGWNLVAVLEHERLVEGGTNFNSVRAVPGEYCPEKYRTIHSYCDHCNSDRYRKKTFVLINDKDIYKQVGSTCIKDFLGHVSPERIMGQAKWLSILEDLFTEYREPGINVEAEDGLLEVLAWTNISIARDGWVSKARAMENDLCSTAGDVVEQIFVRTGRWQATKGFVPYGPPTDEDYAAAQASIDWIMSHDPNEANDYIYNCFVIAKSGGVRSREYGIACSILGSHKGHLARLVKKEFEEKHKVISQYVLEVGIVFDQKVTLEKEFYFEGFYGPGAILKFRDESGNIITWKTSPQGLTEGDQYYLRGRIKAHDEFRDEKQTVLSRCKVKEIS